MQITHVFSLLGGLALFIYGMGAMGEGLELAAGNKLQKILERLTSNRILGMLVGLGVTAIVQSSSATTVMAVGFVNSQLMTLTQAINVILGANIGTTVTGQLIALNITELAPIISFIGLIFFMMKTKRFKYIGQILLGLGFLFMGMGIMSSSMSPLRDSPVFIELMTNISNPFLGILVGTVVTAIIQSSSASVGLLQALAMQGLIPFSTSMYIVFGQNIGTCVTSVLASIGTSNNAKRVACSHVLFNVFGTIIFVALSFMLPLGDWIEALTPNNPMRQIANLHTIFNVTTTLIVLPFTPIFANLAKMIIVGEDKISEQKKLIYVTNQTFGDAIVMVSNIKAELMRMQNICKENFNLALTNLHHYSDESYAVIQYNEEVIDYLNAELAKASLHTLTLPLTDNQSEIVSNYITIASNLERVGDYSNSISSIARKSVDKSLTYTTYSQSEIEDLQTLINIMFDELVEKIESGSEDMKAILTTDVQLGNRIKTFRKAHLKRMTAGSCSIEAGLYYDKILSYVARIRDHLVHVGENFDVS